MKQLSFPAGLLKSASPRPLQLDVTTSLRVALFSVDPPGLTLFRAFDPESFFVIPAINDALVHIDSDGLVRPSLAIAWSQVSPCELELELRQGVRFHDGSAFDADDVVATFAAHHTPGPSASALAVLATIKAVHKIDAYRVRIETHHPDTMLVRRLFFFSVYPKGALAERGREGQELHPVGTGAYRLARYERGREIVLERNPDHWAKRASVDVIHLPILRQKEWVHRLSTGEIDVALNLDCHDRMRAERIPGIVGASREAALSQWFFLANRGPLADARVRRALNHAVNRRLLVDLTEHGYGAPQRSVANTHTEGYVALAPYRYSPELARKLLSDAGYAEGFRLHGLVSETSTALYFAVREFLSRIGVTLEADIVPRGTWMQTVVGGNVTGNPYGGDFALTSCDNPVLHSLFLQYTFFHSQGTGSIVKDAGFDERAIRAATAVDNPGPALAELERYHRDEALMLFTVEQHAHAAWREGLAVELPRSGHFDAGAFWSLEIQSGDYTNRPSLPPASEPSVTELGTLLEGTSHTGAFYLGAGAKLDDPTAKRIWTNLTESEKRWRVQEEPMLRELVSAIEARANLSNILSSTDRVAIVGCTPEGRELFHNRGYELMFGEGDRGIFARLGSSGAHGWPAIERAVEESGAWLGPVHLSPEGRPSGAPEHLFLAVSPAVDTDGATIGYTFVLSDFSGEEERIKTAATRTILENVPYGLFMLDREGRMLDGYSDACRDIFVDTDNIDLKGRKITSLLGMNRRAAENFETAYEQVIEDFFPPEVSLGQLPSRVEIGDKTYALHGSVVHDEDGGGVKGVLFTANDISALVQAEREAEHHRATIAILRYKDAFESFVRELEAKLRAWETGRPVDGREVRAELHTAKGVLSQFSLLELAAFIHELEDHETIEVSHLGALREKLVETTRSHGIDPTARVETHLVEESTLVELERYVRSASSPEEELSRARAVFAKLREKTVADVLGPIVESAAQLAERRGKSVSVEVRGAGARVPKHLVEPLSTLVHLVRNAVDHGIEPIEERAEKSPEGKLTLEVQRDERTLHVTVTDDGRGIDETRVVAKAVGMGVLTDEDASRLPVEERLALVFVDGLSTANDVTDVSGRGVGVAATKAAVEAVGGKIQLRSRVGIGTTFSVTLPLESGAPENDEAHFAKSAS